MEGATVEGARSRPQCLSSDPREILRVAEHGEGWDVPAEWADLGAL